MQVLEARTIKRMNMDFARLSLKTPVLLLHPLRNLTSLT